MHTQNILITISIISTWILVCDSLPNWSSKGGFCQSTSDCPPNHCCAIGFVRYSFPQCLPFGETGDWCRAYNPPENKSLAFPNGQYYEFFNIYTQFCPCNGGLICDRAKCALNSNHINSVINFFDEFY